MSSENAPVDGGRKRPPGREEWLTVRCLFEAPILDERKWAKVPAIPADAFILDLEDSVPLDRKDEARVKVVEYLGRPDYFNGALMAARANNLETPWGREDLIAFAEAGAETVMYPKASTPDELRAVRDLLAEHGSDAKLLACVESARGVVEVERIAAMDEVVAIAFGPGDLHVDAHIPLYDENGDMNPALLYPKARCALAGSAFRVAVLGIAYLPDIRDQEEARKRLMAEKAIGFTGVASFYPPQVPIINEVFSPSEAEIAVARAIVESYEQAVAAGNPAVQLPNGEAVLVHQYKESLNLLKRA
jgi:citrate lyase beta subunit